jgi:hypothetical protein
LASPTTNRRINNLDAARGVAMALVCLSHFIAVYFRRQLANAELPWPIALGMIASPTFVAISGTLLGLLFVVRRETFRAMRVKLIDRSLFALTIGHVLIACSRLAYEGRPISALSITFMTDAIAVCVIVGSLLIPETSRSLRIALGLACYALAWRLLYLWTPHETFDGLLKDILVGGLPVRVLGYSVPVLQWFGVYIACTAAGEYLGEMYRDGALARVERALLTAGLAALALGVALRCAGWVLASRHAFAPATAYWTALFSPWSKLPPSPVYVLCFGGLGILCIWGVSSANHRGLAPWLVNRFATVGRCSLAVFTLQYYVYYLVLDNLPLPRSNVWPLVYLTSLALLLVFASWWDRKGFNRLLSVGLQQGLELAPRLTPVSASRTVPAPLPTNGA